MWGELLVSVWSKLTTLKIGHFDFQNRPLVATPPTVAADAAKEASEAASYDDGRVIVIAG
jgi:hypothetical protein